ncbi:double-strand break repair protein AddB [Devosia sp.]|jgi:ATP-dependent helicase/nuclease subunit B|uniref:double-strand break repair protein AddB n=1 Tax=Devosia sp. TaxID=1871048 RepID=UPI0037BFA848
MSRPQKLFSIAPDAPFLATLADRVLDGTVLGDWPRTGPFWLADVTIVLPTRRARLKLAQALMERGHTLLPDIRTFGGEVADEEPFLPPFDAPAMPQPVPPLSRTLTLARLIDAWARTEAGKQVLATPPNAAEVLGLATSLGGLLDDLIIENVSADKVLAVPKEHLPENWLQVLEFLNIALKVWPAINAERGLADAAHLRNLRLQRQAAAAPLLYGDRPVVAAGSTGSIPATADLLAAIADLPRGALVLPGLDTTLSSKQHEALLEAENAPHGHAQYGLARLLRRLGTTHSEVVELSGNAGVRTRVVRTALALAADTEHWAQTRHAMDSVLSNSTTGVTIVAARTQDEEAAAIVLAARDALARRQSVGIISPDQSLSRRIAMEFRRFGVEVDDAAGMPLFQSPAGRLARVALACAVSGFAPVDLMALLQNAATTLGLERRAVGHLTQQIDLGLLRGQRPATGLAGLRALLEANVAGRTRHPHRRLTAEDAVPIADLLDRLERAIGPLCDLIGRKSFTAADLAAQLAASLDAIVGPADFPGLETFRRWAADLAALGGEGPAIRPVTLDAVLGALMAGITVTDLHPGRDDVMIWGQLEARLQNPDLLILAGLNEEVWPRVADPGPWLSRGMRLAAGLEPPERQQGQAAHDFEMAMGNANVVLAFAERRGTAPALPSRFLQRLEAFLGPAAKPLRQRGQHWLDLARRLDAVAGLPVPAARPMPSPPVDKRPHKLSVTEIETLFRSPYDVYAKHVLKLRKLPALGDQPDARERGSMIHDVFDRFVNGGHDFAAPDARAVLMRMAEEAFAGLDAIGERRDIWLKRFERAAEEFLAYERGREALVLRRNAEISGAWVLPIGFTLTGKADRIDALRDGSLQIIDFKTGSIPTPKAMKAFEAPQLLLEAAMAQAGAFPDVPPAPISALTYIKIGLGPDALTALPFKPRDGIDLPAAADEVARRLQGHVEALLMSDARPLAARIRPDITRRYRGDYDHLARTDEWTIQAGEDE